MGTNLNLTERQAKAIYGQLRGDVLLGSRLPIPSTRDAQRRYAHETQVVTDEGYLTVEEVRDAYERMRDFLFPLADTEAHSVRVGVA